MKKVMKMAVLLGIVLLQACYPAAKNCVVKEEPDKKSMDLWNFTGMNWSLWNRNTREQILSDSEMEKRADYLKGLGVNTVFINGLHFRLSFLDRNKRTLEQLKRVTAICHARGMKVIEHLDLTIPLYLGTSDMLKHPEWLQIDARYGSTVARWYCFNNPDFQKWSINYLKDLLRKTDVDGFSLDEVGYSISRIKEEIFCGCGYCRKKLKEDTRVLLSENSNSLFWNNYDDSAWRRYVKWRITSKRDYMIKVSDELRKIRPDIFFTGYNTNFANVYARDHGGCMWEDSKVPNMFTGIEIWVRLSTTASFPFIMADLKLRSAIADHWNRPSWIIVTPEDDETFIFTWAMTRMAKQRPWINKTLIPEGQMKKCLAAPPFMNDENCRILTDIGVLFSTQARDAYKDSSAHGFPVTGWLEFLIMNNIQADALMDDDLNPEILSKYRLLILPNSSALSEKQIAALISFIEKGGSVICSLETGGLNENGESRGSNLFLNHYGLKNIKMNKGGIKLFPSPWYDEKDFSVTLNDRFAVPEIDGKDFKVLAELESQGKRYPGIMIKKIGKGNLLYSGVELGNLYFMNEILKGGKIPVWHGEKYAPFLMKILTTAYDGRFLSAPVKVPDGLIYYIYKDSSNGSLIIQTLNTAGRKNLFQGDGPLKEKITYPANGGMVVDILYPGSARPSATVVQADGNGRTVECKRLDSEYIRLDVPGEILKTYSIIRIDKGE